MLYNLPTKDESLLAKLQAALPEGVYCEYVRTPSRFVVSFLCDIDEHARR